jgi:hypothetical protein
LALALTAAVRRGCALADECRGQGFGGLRQGDTVRRVVGLHGRRGRRKIVQDLRKQVVVQMNVERLTHALVAKALERKGEAGRVEMGLETGGTVECSDVELVGVFEGYFGNGFCHRCVLYRGSFRDQTARPRGRRP